MPDTRPGIKFNEEGICSACQSFENRKKIDWNQRYKDNLEKMKTGKLFEVVEVVKSLYDREKSKGLSSNEKKLLSAGKRIVLSEIIYSYNIDLEKAEDLLANLVLNC